MKIQSHEKDMPIIQAFLAKWMIEDKSSYAALSLDECETLYLDCDELHNCFMELEKKGFVQSVKEIFQGNHFYRSDTKKCPRCWRYRMECYWNSLNGLSELCDRCYTTQTASDGG